MIDTVTDRDMLLVLEESGDDGLVVSPGRSPWLVIGGALFPTHGAATACRTAVQELRQRHGGKEFHFTEDADSRRRLLLDCLAGQDFTYHAVACNRLDLPPAEWRQRKQTPPKPVDLTYAVSGRLMAHLVPRLTGCTVWFDSKNRKADQLYAKHLTRRAGVGPGGLDRVTGANGFKSHRELLIQVADYVCGAVARSLRPKQPDERFLKLLGTRRGEVIFWPANPAGHSADEIERGGPRSRPASS